MIGGRGRSGGSDGDAEDEDGVEPSPMLIKQQTPIPKGSVPSSREGHNHITSL